MEEGRGKVSLSRLSLTTSREHVSVLSKERAAPGPGTKVTLGWILLHPDVDLIEFVWEMKGKKRKMEREGEIKGEGGRRAGRRMHVFIWRIIT